VSDEPIEMSLEKQTLVDLRNHALDGLHIGATWRIHLNDPYFDYLLIFRELAQMGK